MVAQQGPGDTETLDTHPCLHWANANPDLQPQQPLHARRSQQAALRSLRICYGKRTEHGEPFTRM